MKTYKSHIHPFSENFKLIRLTDQELSRIDVFTQEVIQKKKTEQHHQIDNGSHYKRFFTGTMGELALEKYLGVTGIVDWTVGDSSFYHKPDLSSIGLNVGVKTVQYGLFPIIFKKSYSPEVIMIRWKKRHIYICGIATAKTLNAYQDDDLIKSPGLKAKGTKTGFYGFHELEQLTPIMLNVPPC